MEMTKTKRQLRAEAVERLKGLDCPYTDQMLDAITDGKSLSLKGKLDAAIDLLTDDEQPQMCHNISKSAGYFVCSECGSKWHVEDVDFSMTLTLKNGIETIPRFCQWCGCRIDWKNHRTVEDVLREVISVTDQPLCEEDIQAFADEIRELLKVEQ